MKLAIFFLKIFSWYLEYDGQKVYPTKIFLFWILEIFEFSLE